MYNFSNEAKQRVLSGKITRAYLKVLATDTEPEIIINESNYLKDLTFEELRYVPDEGFIGGTVSKRVTGNFNNVDSTFSIQDREFELYIGVDLEDETTEYIKYGTFIVQKPDDDQVTDNTSFEALDYMIKLNLPYVDRITYPCTLKQLFDDLVDQSGLSTTVTSFLNQDFIVENNQFEEGTTRRDVLKAIAQIAFNWARVDENNNIVMDFEKKDNIAETLTIDNYYNFSKQNVYGPINVIILRNSQVEGENITIKDEDSINISKTKNICHNTWILGQYSTTGEIYTYENRIRTVNLISINPNTEYYLNTFNNNYKFMINAYNKNKEFLRNLSFTDTFTSNENEYYISVTLYSETDTTNDLIELINNGTIKPFICLNSEENKNYIAYESTGETEFVIADNPFAYTQEKRQELIEAGRYLFGLTYVPMSMDMIGYIYLNCKDKIQVKNLNNESFDTYLLNHTITYEGTVSDSMESPAMTKTETQYQFTPQMIQALKHTELLVDKANQRIDAVIENVTENSEKIVELELTVDGIQQSVTDIENLTNTVEGVKTITLENCVEGNLLELHIYGNNTVFDYLYPRNDLYPSDNLYPHGDSMIEVIDNDGNSKIYDLGITEVLRQNGDVYDEYVLDNGKAKIIRRINPDGTIKYTETEEDLGDFNIPLTSGTNIITIKNYSATLMSKFAVENDLVEIFATKVEMNSSITQTAQSIELSVNQKLEGYSTTEEMNSTITQTAQEINSEVSKKVGDDEIISKINQSAEQVTIDANRLNINGTISANGNFKVDTDGTLSAINANLSGKFQSGDFPDTENNKRGVVIQNGRIICTDIDVYSQSDHAQGLKVRQNGDTSWLYISNNGLTIYDNSELSSQVFSLGYPLHTKPFISMNDGDLEILRGNIHLNNGRFYAGQITVSGNGFFDASVYAPDFVNTSKKEKKKNKKKIKEIEKSFLDIVKNTDICEFNFKGKKCKQFGVVIGKGYNAPDEILSENKEGSSLYSMISVLYAGFQEYIQKQEIKNKELEEKINKLEEKLKN